MRWEVVMSLNWLPLGVGDDCSEKSGEAPIEGGDCMGESKVLSLIGVDDDDTIGLRPGWLE